MKMTEKIAALAVFAGILFFPGCKEPEVAVSPVLSDIPVAIEEIAEEEKTTENWITIVAAGDNLIHDIIYNRVRVAGDSFNFDPGFIHVKPIIKNADIAFVNQETVLGGKQFGFSGYPAFNTPQEAGLALINAGFTVANQASNHILDKGEKAAFATMDFWESHGIPYLGVFRSEEKRNTERIIIEKNGITVGFLSYTYALNGYPLPKDKPWMVGLIDKEVMAREIDDLRPHCDLLVVSMHWGLEFQHTPNNDQKELAELMALHNVDLILGHHPHVTQPVEVIDRSDGGKLHVYYSLGDFLSHTQSSRTPDTITGALAYIRVKKTQTGDNTSCTIETASVIPTVCHYNRERVPFVVYPLWDYTNELASKHFKEKMTLEYLRGVAQQVFGDRVLDREQYEQLCSQAEALQQTEQGQVQE